jgi:Uncharacterized protein conserved in bacteria
MNTHAHASKPWFKEPWPWLLAIMPVTAVVAGSFTAWLAVTSSDGLVVDDYYKQGKAINQTKARDRQAQTLGIRAQLLPRGSALQMQLEGRLPTPPGQLTLKIMHPTRSGDDHDIRLNWDGSAYSGQLPQLAGARYKVQLTPEHGDWRLTGIWPTGNNVTLNPQL